MNNLSPRIAFSPERGLISNAEFVKKIASVDLPVITTNKRVKYYDVPAAFDTEVSSFYTNGEKNGVMYAWAFGILNWVTYGRTWDQFIALMTILSDLLGLNEQFKLVVYVHNLPYEFAFMRSRINFDKVFLLDSRKPVYANWGGFEFRCSLKLSSKSLKKVGDDLVKYHEHKHIGDLDYQLIRFHSTPLTKEELGYIEADVRVLLAYIQEKIETDGSIAYIPLTNTGYVRNYCRKACFRSFKSYRKLMSELTLEPEEYAQLKRGFAGGFTHASAKYVASGLETPLEQVSSYDFTSSYIAVLLLEKFPMSKSKVVEKIDSMEQFRDLLKKYCCLFDVTLRYVRPKVDYDHIISLSKVVKPRSEEKWNRLRNSMTVDNGRIVTAEEITLTMTEQDWFVFEKFYDYGSEDDDLPDIVIHNFRYYEKGYLPKEFYMSILDLYKKKTELKDVDGEEINYMILKNMLNATYGMIVTDIVRDIYEYDNDKGFLPRKKPDLADAIDKYNNSIKRFLFYPWGVWVTAYARKNLFSGILACGDDYIYSDTDSLKIFNREKHEDYIASYNDMVRRKIAIAAKHFNIDEALYSPCNRKGKPKTIGLWDYEGTYKRFKTLGAKRYFIEYENGSHVLTTAGVNKEKACKYLEIAYDDPFDGFTNDLCVPAEYSGRLTLTYFDTPCEGIGVDYLGNSEYFYEKTFIHMEPSDYNLTVSDEYKSFLQFMFNVVEDSW